VLRDANLELRAGSVHSLVGDNGAGKSTRLRPARGGRPSADYSQPLQPLHGGVATVFQESNLPLPDRSVAENVFLGREPHRVGLVGTSRMRG
jgi:ABC-type sugar transport system ATPase subunit